MWWERSDSIIEPRISRATMAICGSASVRTGPILLSSAPSFQPPIGSRFQVRPKTSWITGAMTKVGIVLPAVAVAMTA